MIALSAAFAVPAAGTSAAVASPAYLYVNNASGAHCSNSGSGTQAQPYCTISAAAAVVQPGQTVYISPGQTGYDEEVDITRSGTAAEPITFANLPVDTYSGDNYAVSVGGVGVDDKATPYAILISGAQHVIVKGLSLMATDGDVRVQNSSDITVQGNQISGVSTDVPQVQVAGSSSDVVITQNQFQPAARAGIDIDGATGTVVSTNAVYTSDENAVTATDAPGTEITGNNLLSGCGTALVLAGASTGSTVENNAVETAQYEGSAPQACAAGSADTGITVAAGSTSGTEVAYNVIDPKSGGSAYSWAGANYATVAAFAAASGQGSHDIVADPHVCTGESQTGSPLIDSADANAPGETATDVYGTPRLDDRMVANTGTGVGYYDRGAYEDDQFGSTYVPVTPLRVLDTRNAIGVKTTVPVAAGATVDLAMRGAHGLPAIPYDLDAAVLNVTVTDSKAAGYLSVYQGEGLQPGGPKISSLNWSKGQTISSLITAAIPDQSVAFTNHSTGTVDVIADLQGYYAMTGTSTFSPLSPTRVLDTRSAKGVSTRTPLAAGGVLALKVAGTAGIPSSGATAVVLNVTATEPTAATYVSVYPDGVSRPTVSNLNLSAKQTLPNEVIVPLGADGKIDFYNHAGSTHLIADVEGYYTTSGVQTFQSMTATSFLDTRSAIGVTTTTPLGSGGVITLSPTAKTYVGQGDKVTAVVLDVTVTDPTSSSFLTVYPAGGALPTASNLNWVAGQTVSNQVMVPVGKNGEISFYNHSGKVHVLASIAGYFYTQ